MHLLCRDATLQLRAGGVGFEPTRDLAAPNGFQDRSQGIHLPAETALSPPLTRGFDCPGVPISAQRFPLSRGTDAGRKDRAVWARILRGSPVRARPAPRLPTALIPLPTQHRAQSPCHRGECTLATCGDLEHPLGCGNRRATGPQANMTSRASPLELEEASSETQSAIPQ